MADQAEGGVRLRLGAPFGVPAPPSQQSSGSRCAAR